MKKKSWNCYKMNLSCSRCLKMNCCLIQTKSLSYCLDTNLNCCSKNYCWTSYFYTKKMNYSNCLKSWSFYWKNLSLNGLTNCWNESYCLNSYLTKSWMSWSCETSCLTCKSLNWKSCLPYSCYWKNCLTSLNSYSYLTNYGTNWKSLSFGSLNCLNYGRTSYWNYLNKNCLNCWIASCLNCFGKTKKKSLTKKNESCWKNLRID